MNGLKLAWHNEISAVRPSGGNPSWDSLYTARSVQANPIVLWSGQPLSAIPARGLLLAATAHWLQAGVQQKWSNQVWLWSIRSKPVWQPFTLCQNRSLLEGIIDHVRPPFLSLLLLICFLFLYFLSPCFWQYLFLRSQSIMIIGHWNMPDVFTEIGNKYLHKLVDKNVYNKRLFRFLWQVCFEVYKCISLLLRLKNKLNTWKPFTV